MSFLLTFLCSGILLIIFQQQATDNIVRFQQSFVMRKIAIRARVDGIYIYCIWQLAAWKILVFINYLFYNVRNNCFEIYL